MKIVVGLGNPGKKYEGTRHNSGFRVLDGFGDIAKIDIDKSDFHGLLGRGKVFDEDVILFKPQTFMNLSGTAVREIVQFYKVDLSDLLVIYDDMALEPGVIRMRKDGSSGGQKGMQNIIDCLSSEEIKRIRIGIGEPPYEAIDYVLGRPSGDEKEALDGAIEKAVKALREVLLTGFDKAMSIYNHK